MESSAKGVLDFAKMVVDAEVDETEEWLED